MSAWLSAILEILKFTLPPLVVFTTVYYVLKQYLDSQYRLKALEARKKQTDKTLPLKLQAYERLSLFCERIALPSLILRLRESNMTVDQLRFALMLSVQKEFEHNLSQQIYVSAPLWQIIRFAKDETLSYVNLTAKEMNGSDDASALADRLLSKNEENQGFAVTKALEAIKKEVNVLLS